MRVTALWFVSIQPPDREQPAASPHPGALQPASKPSPSCLAPPSRLPPPSRFISHPPPSSAQHHARFRGPAARLRPPLCSVSFPVRVSALHRAWFRGPAPLPPSPSSISRPRPRLRFPPFWASRRGPSAASTVCGFACRFAPRPPRSAARRPPRLISGSARVSRLSVCARRPHLLSAEPSAGPRSPPARSGPASVGFGRPRLVPDLARLNSGRAPLALGVRSRVPIACPGFSSRPRAQIRPTALPKAARCDVGAALVE